MTPQHLCIAMEFASGGDMFEYVVKKNGLREDEARWFFQQLIVGLDYCHRMVSHGNALHPTTSCNLACVFAAQLTRLRCSASQAAVSVCSKGACSISCMSLVMLPWLATSPRIKSLCPNKHKRTCPGKIIESLVLWPLQGVVNRDIKLENTLLDSSPRPLVKICDFGYSKVYRYDLLVLIAAFNWNAAAKHDSMCKQWVYTDGDVCSSSRCIQIHVILDSVLGILSSSLTAAPGF